MRRVVVTARAVGVRVLVAQAIDEAANRFYEQRGFDPTATDPMLLIWVDMLRVRPRRGGRCAVAGGPPIHLSTFQR